VILAERREEKAMTHLKKCVFILASALAIGTIASGPTSASPPDPESGLAAPFSPSGTIYRPECPALLEASWLCGNAGSR
jgi:hypothetical protein